MLEQSRWVPGWQPWWAGVLRLALSGSRAFAPVCRELWSAWVWIVVSTYRVACTITALLWRRRYYEVAALAGLAVMLQVAHSLGWRLAPSAPRVADLPVPASGVAGDFADLARRCAPHVAPNTLLAIMRTESGFNPVALHVNGDFRMARVPRSPAEAIGWTSWLIGQGYSVDIGLMQINSHNLARLRLTVAEAFEPCHNLAGAATILQEQYHLAAQVQPDSAQALLAAISAYNTGNFRDGFRNGYVARVLGNSRRP